MPYDPCKDCSGEDCVCCEVWIERQADMRAEQYRDPYEQEDDFRDEHEDDWDDDDDDLDESMDGDFDSGMASAGFGYDEQYEHDTPLGDLYGSGFGDDEGF